MNQDLSFLLFHAFYLFLIKEEKMALKKMTIGIIGLVFVLTGCPTPADSAYWTPQYALGDTGPGSGQIFYINLEGFTCDSDGSTCHYLEVAPSDSGALTWITPGYDSPIVDQIMIKIWDVMGMESYEEKAIGMGRKNTQIILAHDATAPAALACANLTAGGKSDWFLPSMDELNQLRIYIRIHKTALGITGDSAYWSSSIHDLIEAQYMDFKRTMGNYKANDINKSEVVST
jgi:hypothetical protein